MNDQQLATERAAFEKWAEEYGLIYEPNYSELTKKDCFAAWQAALAQRKPVHSDDEAVDRFSVAMKEKLAKSRAKGRGGWDDHAQCTVEFLSQLLVEHVAKGDPVDVANLAMMLHQRSSGIVQREAVAHEGVGETVTYMRMYDAKDRYSIAQPFDVQKIHDAADLLERTEAARLAAEEEIEEAWLISVANNKELARMNEQLATERARSEKLMESMKDLFPWVITQEVACHGLKCREAVCSSCTANYEEAIQQALAALQKADEALAAYQSSKEND